MNLTDFFEDVKTISQRSVTFHFKRGVFAKWIHDILHDPTLARRIRRIKKSYTGTELRNKISKIVQNRRALENAIVGSGE
jgi:hypothetical protein